MAEISERLLTTRTRLERSRRELVLMADCFSATVELAQAIAEISELERQARAAPAQRAA
jgi:hypothetical protein